MLEDNFKTAVLGFNKDDVRNYIDNIISDNQRMVKVKEEEITKLRKSVSDLELRMSRLKNLEDDYAKLQKQVSSMSDVEKQKDKRIAELSLELDELKGGLSSELPIVEQRVEQHIEQTEGLDSDINTELIKKIDTLKKELRVLSEKNNELASDNKQLALDNNKLVDDNNKLSDDHNKLVLENVKLSENNTTLMSDNKELVADNTELSKELEAVNLSAIEYSNQIKKLNAEIQEKELAFKAEVDKKMNDLSVENAELKIQVEELKQLEQNIDQEKMKIAKAVLRAQEKAESMEKEIKIKFDEENARLQNYRKEIDELRNRAVVILGKFEAELKDFIEEDISKKVVAKIAK